MFGLKACVLAAGLLLPPAVSTVVASGNPAPGKPSDDKKAKKKAAKKATKKGDKTAPLFKKLDSNNDGKLSPMEFAKLKEAQTALKGNKAKNANKVQKVNKANKAAKAKKANKKADQLPALFKKLDMNNDGFLTSTEFAKLKEVQKATKATNPKKKNKAKK